MKVWIVTRDRGSFSEPDISTFGIFSSEEKAKATIAQFIKDSRLPAHFDAEFSIEEVVVDEII